jgi:hypothetical protein
MLHYIISSDISLLIPILCSQPMILSRQSKGYDGEYPLMLDEEVSESNHFKSNQIYPQIQQDWNKNVPLKDISEHDEVNEGQQQLLDAWINHANSYRIPIKVAQVWDPIYIMVTEYFSNVKQQRERMERSRIQKTISVLSQREIDFLRKRNEESEQTAPPRDKRLLAKIEPMYYRKLLPDNVCTQMCIRYDVTPGQLTAAALRVLATDMFEGRITVDFTMNQILDYIDGKGGLVQFSRGHISPWVKSD